MSDLTVLCLFAAIALVPAVLMFLQRRLVNAVICLAFSALGSALLLVYLGQTLAAALQLLVFAGGLAAYLVVAVASEERQAKISGPVRFLVAAAVIFASLSVMYSGVGGGLEETGNSFVSSAVIAFEGQYALLYASVFMLFAAAAGGVLVMKRFSKV